VKLIALLPFKDEAWILPAYLSSVAPVVDEIIALDDGSTDASRQLVEAAGGTVVANEDTGLGWAEHSVATRSRMNAAWATLLRLGRERGGTHFLCLDADEALTAPCRAHLREALAALEPRQKLAMRWLTLWKRRDAYREDDSVWSGLYKDFAFADAPDDPAFDIPYLGVARTPGDNDEARWARVPVERCAVLHFQFVPWERSQAKQAWYRCVELIREPGRAYDINRTYSISTDQPGARTAQVPLEWIEGLEVPAGIEQLPPAWHLERILEWFDEHGIEFFEPIAIWHVPQLHAEFVRRVGREPEPLLRLPPVRRVAHALAARARAARHRG
jgi:hypothetical protein